MKMVVVGANGLIGRHVVREALSSGYEAIAVTSKPLSGVDWPPTGVLTERRADIESVDSLRAALEGADFVIHCAGYYPTIHTHVGLLA